MNAKKIIVIVVVLLAILFLFRASGYAPNSECTSANSDFKAGKRCHGTDGKVSLSPTIFCEKDCTGSWK